MKKEWFPVWVFPVIAVMAVGTVWLRLTVIRTSYQINQSDRMIQQARLEKDKLELKVSGLKSPRKLEQLARSRFGLRPPQTDQIITMKSSVDEAKK